MANALPDVTELGQAKSSGSCEVPTPFGVLPYVLKGVVAGLAPSHCTGHSRGAASGMYTQTLLQIKSPPLACVPGAL